MFESIASPTLRIAVISCAPDASLRSCLRPRRTLPRDRCQRVLPALGRGRDQ